MGYIQKHILFLTISVVLAILLPFEVFLFAYLVLGPIHYLSEVNWLRQDQQTQFMQLSREDLTGMSVWGGLFFITFLGIQLTESPLLGYLPNVLLWGGVGMGAGMIFSAAKGTRIGLTLGGLILGAICSQVEAFDMLPAVVPSLVHVIVLTFFLLIFDIRKAVEKQGMVIPVLFIVGLVLTFLLPYTIRQYTMSNVIMDYYYQSGFASVMADVLGIFKPETTEKTLFYSNTIYFFQRAFAFAFLYHYLFWLDKVDILKTPRKTLLPIVGIWVVTVILFFISPRIGTMILLLLNYTHFFMELPYDFAVVKKLFGGNHG